MKPFERQPHPITLTAAIIAVAVVVLVLASTSLRRADTAAYAADVAAVATATATAAVEDNRSAIRPFRVTSLKWHSSISAGGSPRRGGPKGDRLRPVARRAVGTLQALSATGDGVRLAQDRGEAQCPAAVRHQDRRAGHPLHPRPVPHPNALPMIITHGWPGSVLELIKVIGPLTIPPRTAAAPRTRSTS